MQYFFLESIFIIYMIKYPVTISGAKEYFTIDIYLADGNLDLKLE